MNNDVNVINTPDVDYSDVPNNYKPKKFKAVDILIFVICLILAFAFWCYATYLDDPIIKKKVTVNFVVDGGNTNETLSPASHTITVYGKRSLLNDLTSLTVKVNRSDFKEYDVSTLVNIKYPNNISSDTKQIKLKLINDD